MEVKPDTFGILNIGCIRQMLCEAVCRFSEYSLVEAAILPMQTPPKALVDPKVGKWIDQPGVLWEYAHLSSATISQLF